MNFTSECSKHVTVFLPGGLVKPSTMQAITEIAERFNLTMYLTTVQNMRLLGATDENFETIKKELVDLGLKLKAPGKFPLPKVCVGQPFCNLGLADTFALSDTILARYGDRQEVKPKYKISISGCPACCGGSMLADIGIVATRKGFDLYAGGKGGPLPKTGRKLAKGLSEAEVVDAVGKIADFHGENTAKKTRIAKLIDSEGFPQFNL